MKWVKPVKIPATRFFDTDALGIPESFALKPGQFVQGAIVAKSNTEARVWIVIVLAPGSTVNEGKWWPRVVQHQVEMRD